MKNLLFLRLNHRKKNLFGGKNGTARTVPDYNKDAAAFNDKEKGGKAVAMFSRPSNIYACQMESGRMAGWKYFWPCMGSLVRLEGKKV